MYTLAGISNADAERALAGIIDALLTAPEKAVRFGSGDLAYYKDIATMDPHPGFLNGLLSLVLNSTEPSYKYDEENNAARAYFHRVRASELMALFGTRFPQAAARSALETKLVRVYATYGDSDGVIRAGRQFLSAFPDAAERTDVAMLVAEAYARKGQTREEFTTYDALLKELASRADGVPLGNSSVRPKQETTEEPAQEEEAAPQGRNRGLSRARSPEYQRVLDRYLARLAGLKRPLDALRLLRGELDRNPGDPGIYERLASFLEQSRMDAEVEQIYKRAIGQFGGTSWHDRLARWYLRRKQTAAFDQITRQVVEVFSGADLENYFGTIVSGSAVTPALYVQVNTYAHQRFPLNMTFVRNLVKAYRSTATFNRAAFEGLLRNYWYYDDGLRAQFFQLLSSEGRLDAEVQSAAAGKQDAKVNPAAVRFVAEAEAWRTHFEDAAPGLEAVAALYPADAGLAGRAAKLDRSLVRTDAAVGIEEKLQRFDPRDRGALTRIGETYADRELYERARPYWNRIAAIEPGRADGYLEAATVFWDYFLYDDALRLMEAGRAKLANPALYAYEAGAVYENKRNYARAVEEYAKGAQAGSRARSRLVQLARRPAQRALVEKLLADRTAAQEPDETAVSLRIAVLENQNRRAELEGFLSGLATRTSSMDLLETIRGAAQRDGLETVEERVLDREAAVVMDPVERARLRLGLMRFYEGRHDVARARQTVEALYKQSPLILGVVRATADFYWRNKMQTEAVDVLARAADAAAVPLKNQFTMEAAVKATEAGDYRLARAMLTGLLRQEPLRADYVAAMADTYARQRDDAGLRAFYESKIAEAGKDKERTAALRRSLIPVLTRQTDYAGAVDQYIEVLKAYPEDEGLTREAASYAAQHTRRPQLTAYFAKAETDSPRDYRWAMVRARLETYFEDMPAAIASYSRATAIRPDRADLHTARASLEERLLRFDEARASYTKVYDLTYHDPRWMQKVAEIYARQGNTDAAVAALRRALIEARPQRPQGFFEAARLLDGWNLLEPARQMAERGAELAGREMTTEYASGATVYAQVLTRLRAHERAFERLKPAPKSEEWPSEALTRMAATVKEYFTPEEKAKFAEFLRGQMPSMPEELRVTMAQGAGLPGLAAEELARMLQLGDSRWQSQLVELQQRRVSFGELARQMEGYAKALGAKQEALNALDQAAEAYRSAGDGANELRVLDERRRRQGMAGQQMERHFALLLERDPERLVAVSGSDDAAANFALRHAKVDLALRAVAARGRSRQPVWTRAYTGLVGLYFADRSPVVDEAFRAALGGGTIGERLGVRVDRSQQLAGGSWFYYGTAYGEYLGMMANSGADDYLPAQVEGAPANAAAYFTLAQIYQDSAQMDKALGDYRRVLELDSKRGDAHDRIAQMLWQQGQQKEAGEEWRAALDGFRMMEDGRLPQEFWVELPRTLDNIGAHKLMPAMKDEADRVLRTYVRRNGEYRVEPLLRAGFAAAGDPAAGVQWLIDLSRAAQNPTNLLESVLEKPWLPVANREPLYERMIEAARAQAAQIDEQRQYADSQMRQWQVRWIGWLVETKQVQRAREALDALPSQVREQLSNLVAPLEVRIAAQQGKMAELLERYAREPERAPSDEVLRRASAELEADNKAAEGRRVLAYVFTRGLDRREFNASNFLGLAEVRLKEGDKTGALSLLHRMTMVADQPFDDLTAAARLLEAAGDKTAAREFLEARAKAVPWDLDARVRLGEARVAAMPQAPYAVRVEAAKLGRTQGLPPELELLSTSTVSAAQAEQPLYYYARLRAAEGTKDAATRIRLLGGALAIDPDPPKPRLELVRTAVAEGRYQLAVSVASALWQQGGLRYTLKQADVPAAREEGEHEYADYLASEFLVDGGLAERERAEIARGLGQAFVKLDQPGAARTLYRIALKLAPVAEVRAELDGIRVAEERRAQNALRRPMIKDGVEQDHLVRPRITGGAE
jgi:cellulose synthase operon protein C